MSDITITGRYAGHRRRIALYDGTVDPRAVADDLVDGGWIPRPDKIDGGDADDREASDGCESHGDGQSPPSPSGR